MQLQRGTAEANIQDSIAAWLRSENVDYQLQYRTRSGPIDVHLKHLRCIIEVKRPERLKGGAGRAGGGPTAPGTGSGKTGRDESALDQISRYIDSLAAHGSLEGGLNWRGVVTDGRRWWIWEWPEVARSGGGGGGGPEIVPGWNGRPIDMASMDELLREIARDDSAVLPWAPDDPTELFSPFIMPVRAAYDRNRSLANTAIQKRLWLEQLKGGGKYPDPEDEDDLFVRHTLLTVIARMVSGVRTNGAGKRGKGRAAMNRSPSSADRLLEGYVGWLVNAPDVLDQIQAVIDLHDWQANQTDVMRALYMGIIPIEQRKSYGEYYTPEWVAEKICIEVIDDRYVARQVERFLGGEAVEPVLDPACGSGTFLHHAAMRLRNSKPVQDAGMDDASADDFVARMVWGIDLHPVAVEMAVANMSRMLPRTKAQSLHVYQGDSLLADTPTATLDKATGNSITLRADGETLTLPRRFVEGRPDAIDYFVSTAVGGSQIPPRITKGFDDDERAVMRRAHKAIKKIIERNGNGVWGWYIRNQSAPMLLADAGRIGRIVSNAPWVRFSEIKDRARKAKLVELAKKTSVYAGSKHKTGLDVSSVFVARCNGMYLSKSGRAGWVLPVTAIKGAGQWERLRAKRGGTIKEFWDLGTIPFPKQGPCCTLMYRKGRTAKGAGGGAGEKPPVLRLVCRGPKPNEHDGWTGVVSKIARLGAAGGGPEIEIPAILTDAKKRPSAWMAGGKKRKAIARQGAILTPSMLVRVRDGTRAADGEGAAKDGNIRVETEPSTHGVWKKMETRRASVPQSWLRGVILGKNILPFAVPFPTLHIIPIDDDGRWIDGRAKRGYWKDACSMYADNCGPADHTPKTLEDQLDYHGKLSSQFPPAPWSVVYNTSGERLYAAAVDGTHVVESSAYRVTCRTLTEADFLAAILNADSMQKAFCESKRSQRHYHKYFWSVVPIPRYDGANTDHAALSALGARARKEARRLCSPNEDGDAATRPSVVAGLQSSGLARKIDVAVKKVLPAYVVMDHKLANKDKRAAGRSRAVARDRNQTRLAA